MNTLEDAFINIGLQEENTQKSGEDDFTNKMIKVPASIAKSTCLFFNTLINYFAVKTLNTNLKINF